MRDKFSHVRKFRKKLTFDVRLRVFTLYLKSHVSFKHLLVSLSCDACEQVSRKYFLVEDKIEIIVIVTAVKVKMDKYRVELDRETGLYCSLYLFTDVMNIAEIHEKVVTGKLRCCVVKASLIIDAFQVVVAANKVALNAKQNRLITKTMYTEILFYLSTSKKISRALTEFGIDDSDKNILVILIHELDEEQSVLEEVVESVKGERVPISRIQEFADMNLVTKTYKIDKEELRASSLLNAIVSRISSKEFIL